jgi:BioD-like phosphotransacetylase family protein
VDLLGKVLQVTEVHSSELGALVASATAVASAAKKRAAKGMYRAGLELRASDAFTLNALLADADALLAALTADALVVHTEEYTDRFQDCRADVASKLSGVRPVLASGADAGYSPSRQKKILFSRKDRPFGLY